MSLQPTAALSLPTNNEHELLPQPTHYQGRPIADLLTVTERAAGCRVYQVSSAAYAPALLPGDLVVAHPLPFDQLATLQAGAHCLVREYYPASPHGDAAFESEKMLRLQHVAIEQGNLLGLADEGNGELAEWPVAVADLLAAYRLTRLLRTL